MASAPLDRGQAAPLPADAPGPARGQPLFWHLSLFAAALVIPALALIVLLFWRAAEAERARVDQDVRDVANAVTVALDRYLVGKQSLLFALATAPSLHEGDYAAFHRQASELARSEGLDLVLRDLSGQLLVDTRVPWGQPLPRSTLDIDWQVIESRRAAVSNLFIDATSQQPSFAVVVPVVRDGHVVAMLSAVAPSERAVPILGDRLPTEFWAASLSDRNGIIVARTRNHQTWVGRPITGELRRAAIHASGTWDGPSHEGAPLRGGYARSPEFGWLTAVGVERGRLMAPLYRMLWLTGAAAAVLGGLSALLAVAFGRRINRSILALADAAASLGQTGEVPRFHSGVAEVDGVGTALVDAAARLREREALVRARADEIQGIYDAAPIGIALFDRDFRFLRINERLAAINGRPHADHVGRPIEDMLAAEIAAALRTMQPRLLAGEEIEGVEIVGPDRTAGKNGTFLVSYRPLRDQRGDVSRFLGIVLDITARREAEAALEERTRQAVEAERLLDALMRYVPAGITIAAAPDVNVVRVSDYGSRLLRRPRAQLEGITVDAHVDAYKVFRSDTGAPALPEALPLTRAVQGGEIVVNEEWLVADEAGRQIPVLCNAGPIRDEAGNVVAGVITWHDITELKSAQEHQRLLLLELNHRVKNMLATVQAVADQTFQGAASADARQAFSARIVSLARTHDLLARRSWQQAALHDVVLQAVAPFEGAPDPRFDIEAGDDVLLQPKAALALSMALHELATNAVKYGALSNGSGRVGVAWEVSRHSSERLRFSWRESGGPPVYKPSRRGFGSVMIERGLARELNAQVSLDYAPDGLVFQMEMPLPTAGDG
ncbi:MAG: PAS domain-containing protein [Rhodospirillales bacterium]|nr:PAS domain-containing protein [Rhodospirillales bacterium]